MKKIKQPHGGSIVQAEKGETANPNGRPRKLVGDVIKDLEQAGVKPATKTEIQDCYLRLINLEMQEIEARVKDVKQPALVRIVGKAILSGKGFEIIEKMLDRSIGKAEQKMEVDVLTTKKDISKIFEDAENL